LSGLSPSLGREALELVDRDKTRVPTNLHCLDERQHTPVERRGADAESLRRLAPGVGEPLDACRRAEDYRRIVGADSRRRVALSFLRLASKLAA